MRKAIIGVLVLMMILWGSVAFLAGCTSTGTVKSVPGQTLTLLHQQGREGQVEPCGCHTTPFGGIDREYNAIKALRAQDPQLLFVDAGNLFVPHDAKVAMDVYEGRSDVLVGMLNEMGLDTFTPGPSDYRLGVDKLKKLEQAAKFKFVATNVEDAKGLPLFNRYVILEKNQIPVAVLGIVPEKTQVGPGLKVTPPKAAIEKAIAEIAGKAKLIIVASQAGTRQADAKLASQLPKVNVWVGNDPDTTLHEASALGSSLQIDGHRFGYYLGKVFFDLKFPVVGFDSEATLKVNREVLNGYEKGLAKLKDPARRAAVQKKIDDLKKSSRMEPMPGSSTFTSELIALDENNYGTQNEFTEIVAKDRARIKEKAISAPAK